VPRRNLIPYLLLAVLTVGAAVFAVVGAKGAPDTASLSVRNATAKTFGSPAGANSFTLLLTSTVSSGSGTGTISQARLVDYTPPNRMAVYSAQSRRLLGVLTPSAIACTLEGYTAMVAGSTPWVSTGAEGKKGATGYQRTETLAEYTARVPRAQAQTCAPNPTVVKGQVLERALLVAGYLIDLHIVVVVPPQSFNGGSSTAHGVEGETLLLLNIDGTSTASLG
jgi:hypothetical protein